MKLRFTPFLILFAIIYIFPVTAQVVVKGKIMDANGKTIEHASLQIKADNTYLLMTDSLGCFTQTVGYKNKIRISVSHISYFPLDTLVAVHENLNLVLRPKATSIQEISIVSAKKNNLAQVELKQKDFLSLSKSLGETDIYALLQQKTGIAHTSDVSTGLNVRGMQNGYTGLLYAGCELFGPNHILSIYPQFNADAISSVRLISADIPSSMGGFLSSYLIIEPDHQILSQFAGSAETGILTTKLSLKIPILKNKISDQFSIRRSYFDLIANQYNKHAENNTNQLPLYGFTDLNNSLVWQATKSSKINFDITYSKDKLQFNSFATELSSHWTSKLFSLQWENALSNSTDMLIVAGYSGNDLSSDFSSLFNRLVENKISQYQLSSKLSSLLSKSIQFEAGADFKLNEINLNAVEQNNDLEKTKISSDIWSRNASLYANCKWMTTEHLSLKMGTRFEAFQSDTVFAAILPSLAFNYAMEEISVQFSYSEQMQSKHQYVPTEINLPLNVWYPSQKNVPPERASHYDLSINKKVGDHLHLRLSAYFNQLYHLTEFVDGNYLSTLQFKTEIGKGYSKGIESSFSWNSQHIQCELGYTLAQSKRKSPTINQGEWYSQAYDIRQKLDFNISCKLAHAWTITLSQFVQDGIVMSLPTSLYLHQTGDNPVNGEFDIVPVYTKRSNFRLPYSHRMDISATHLFTTGKTKINLSFGVYNVYNQHNPYFIYLIPEKQEDQKTFLKVQEKSLLPLVPFLSLKISF